MHGESAAVSQAYDVVRRMLDAAVRGTHITPSDVALATSDVLRGRNEDALPDTLYRSHRGREIRPKTAGQRAFVAAIQRHTLTFGIGPAGTGKTFLAVVMAVRALRAREVERIVLARPAIEAGEKL
ncbi:MAG TPA: PhoH family protein, partial [Candidatus Baltobacteraceae bacterium]|nr:PhoH family protein [Candidatus Baltobacteraceae bacterium]